MKRCIAVLIAALFLFIACAGTQPSKEPVRYNSYGTSESPPETEVKTRSVGKKVSDFPEAVDLSTPESALAALYRAGTSKDLDAAADLSWTTIDMTGVGEFWTTSDPAVAEVDEYGQVRAIAPGEALIVGTLDDTTAFVQLHVFDPGAPRARGHRADR